VAEHALQGARALGVRIPPAAFLPPVLAEFNRTGAASRTENIPAHSISSALPHCWPNSGPEQHPQCVRPRATCRYSG
jgi:hypothetical protein